MTKLQRYHLNAACNHHGCEDQTAEWWIDQTTSEGGEWVKAADAFAEIERLQRREAAARAILEPMHDCDQAIRDWLKDVGI